ncbi:MAG: hypothetical protein GY913_10100 [Proteobacteria bacterium]|nr:hypothetical protein [Pseudomonadota bacterium]MCP4917265.1 hypothetical protein [Pseudomonadota bacterium]
MTLLLALACRPTETPITGDVLLLVETGRSQLTLLDRDEAVVRGTQCLHELAPDLCRPAKNSLLAECLPFGVDYSYESGLETLQLTWARRDTDITSGLPGYVTGFEPGHPPSVVWEIENLAYEDHLPDYREGDCLGSDEWSAMCHLNMTHVTEPSPDGQTLVLADTLSSRVVWVLPGDPPQVYAVLDQTHPEWDGYLYSNNVQLFEEDGRTWLLTTFKSGDFPDIAQRNTGRITLWDVTDPRTPELAWAYPEVGHLAAVHHGRVIERDGEQYLLYAHSLGASDSFEGKNGAVGLARFSLDGPTYLGDGILPEGLEGFGFVREVELSPDSDRLYVVDSGCENPDIEDCERAGQLFEVEFPEWDEPGLSGAFDASHSEQSFRELEMVADDWGISFSFPFEVDVLLEGDLGPLFAGEFGACGE